MHPMSMCANHLTMDKQVVGNYRTLWISTFILWQVRLNTIVVCASRTAVIEWVITTVWVLMFVIPTVVSG
jgi:hypothetical protein